MRLFVAFVLIAGAFGAPQSKPRYMRGLSTIIGGTDASPGEIPYQVSFQDISFGFNFHFCGGSIYSENYVITAAHCVTAEDVADPSFLQVVAGELNLALVEGTEQTVLVSRVIQHENFDPDTVENDIALLALSSPLTLDDFVQPIAMPSPGQQSAGNALVSGWGTTVEGGDASDILQKAEVPVISDDACRVSYGIDLIVDTMLCAGYPEGGKDACHGDSGGPLACTLDGQSYLCGVISWGYGCAEANFPGVYTEVSYFIDWLASNAA